MSHKNSKGKERLEELKTQINALDQGITGNVFGIGRCLVEGRKLVGHGYFQAWVESCFSFSHSTALNCINVYLACGGHEYALKNVNRSLLYEISAPRFPELLREVLVENPKLLDRYKLKGLKELSKRLSDEDIQLTNEDIAKLMQVSEQEIAYHEYKRAVRGCVADLDRLAKMAEKVASNLSWPISRETQTTNLPKKAAVDIKGLISRIDDAFRKLQPPIAVVRSRDLRGMDYQLSGVPE